LASSSTTLPLTCPAQSTLRASWPAIAVALSQQMARMGTQTGMQMGTQTGT